MRPATKEAAQIARRPSTSPHPPATHLARPGQAADAAVRPPPKGSHDPSRTAPHLGPDARAMTSDPAARLLSAPRPQALSNCCGAGPSPRSPTSHHPPTELILRWRRTGTYGATLLLSTLALSGLGVPYYLALPICAVLLLLSVTVAFALVTYLHHRHLRVWRRWRRLGGAVCVVQWSRTRKRHELHSWAAFPPGKTLGGAVATAALGEAQRLWTPHWSRLTSGCARRCWSAAATSDFNPQAVWIG